MFKKSVLALFALVFAVALAAPPKAHAGVAIGVAVAPAYGYVEAAPQPYVYAAPAPYVEYAPDYVYAPYAYGRVVEPRYGRPHCDEWREHEWRERQWREHERDED
jgi:hypothetical protein